MPFPILGPPTSSVCRSIARWRNAPISPENGAPLLPATCGKGAPASADPTSCPAHETGPPVPAPSVDDPRGPAVPPALLALRWRGAMSARTWPSTVHSAWHGHRDSRPPIRSAGATPAPPVVHWFRAAPWMRYDRPPAPPTGLADSPATAARAAP